MNKAAVLLILTLGAFGYLLFQRSTADASFDYHHDWSDAVAEAQSSKKPILLNFGGSW